MIGKSEGLRRVAADWAFYGNVLIILKRGILELDSRAYSEP
jgi:hypothetical protein